MKAISNNSSRSLMSIIINLSKSLKKLKSTRKKHQWVQERVQFMEQRLYLAQLDLRNILTKTTQSTSSLIDKVFSGPSHPSIEVLNTRQNQRRRREMPGLKVGERIIWEEIPDHSRRMAKLTLHLNPTLRSITMSKNKSCLENRLLR